MKIQTILILVELNNGHVHQVLASDAQKGTCMAILRSEDGVLRLSERVEPITLESHSVNAKEIAFERLDWGFSKIPG